jgi:chromosome segregation ATPase
MTNRRRTAAFVTVLIVTGIIATRLPVRAQAASNDEMLPALLVEVKGLRAAMEQMASGGSQAQIVVGRLQVQEHRVTSLIDRLHAVHDALDEARSELDVAHYSLEDYERNDTPPGLSQAFRDNQLAQLKAHVSAAKGHVDQLVAEETQLTTDVETEQQRWMAINQRLDDLERALAKR